MKHKLQKVDIDQLKDQRKKKKSKINSKSPIETKKQIWNWNRLDAHNQKARGT